MDGFGNARDPNESIVHVYKNRYVRRAPTNSFGATRAIQPEFCLINTFPEKHAADLWIRGMVLT